MTWRELPPPSVFDRLAGRHTERDFEARVERTFSPDAAAIARVRATVLAHGLAPARRDPAAARRTGLLVRRGLPVAMAFAVVVMAAGLVAVATRTGAPAAGTGSAAEQQAPARADLIRSMARLDEALATVRAGDAAAIATVLAAYRADLLRLEAGLHEPGADLITAAARLRSEADELSTLVGSIPAEDASLFLAVTGDLDRIMASLPGAGNTDHPTATDNPGNTDHPTATDQPGNTDHPTPTDHPGNTDHPTRTDHPGKTDHPTPGANGGTKGNGGSSAGTGSANGHKNTR
jgi:hypothetical protein